MQAIQAGTVVRIRALKGFFATVAGQFGEVNPGSVVDVPRELAAMMVSSAKAEQVDGTVVLTRTGPKVRPVIVDPATERLDRLQASVERLAEAVATLVAAQASAKKKE